MVGRRRDGVELQIKANGQGFDKQLTREIALKWVWRIGRWQSQGLSR